MRYFDCFPFFNEIDLLKLRCEELKDLSVVHVLVESTITHTGLPKPLYFEENKHLFERYNIRHIIVDDLIDDGEPWHSENDQRNRIVEGLKDTESTDIIGIFDADEIPRKEVIQYYDKRMGVAAPVMDKYSCYLNLLEGYQNWNVGRLATPELLAKTTPNELRNMGPNFMINYGGWHFAWLGGMEKMLTKLESFAHQEANNAKFRDKLEYKYSKGQSLWHTDYWKFVEINETFPKYLIENQMEFEHLIKRDYHLIKQNDENNMDVHKRV